MSTRAAEVSSLNSDDIIVVIMLTARNFGQAVCRNDLSGGVLDFADGLLGFQPCWAEG